MNNVPIMPESFKGKLLKHNPLVIHQPRQWTKEEIEWATNLRNEGYTVKEIAYSLDRDYTQVSIKMKRIAKTMGGYNVKHKDEKYKVNEEFFNFTKPSSILDLYAGEKSYWVQSVQKSFWRPYIWTNDKNMNFSNNTSNMSAMELIEYCKEDKYMKFDLIDIDPFGSGIEEFRQAVPLANKGIILTLGEMGHQRFKRIDFVSKHYGINSLEEFTAENIVNKILEEFKELKVWKICKWQNIARVYFVKENNEKNG